MRDPRYLAPPAPSVVDAIIRRALEEDLGRGDVTTDALIPADLSGGVSLGARERLVLSGVQVFARTFQTVDPTLEVAFEAADGDRLAAGAVAARVRGSVASMLRAERVALNLVQRMSGVATLTRAHVDAIPDGAALRVTDTRKTTPGLRALERYAVRCGGGHNHREDLSSAVLIKDNHVAACGSVREAIARARAHATHTSRVECEVDTMAQLDEALEAGAEVILLDNFDDAALREAVARTDGRAFLEASGGVSLARIPAIAATGVDAVSVGALTHSARAVDLGLDWA
jgi:nicotinate-nucleotide pyrophosphorylase (carboxylating)